MQYTLQIDQARALKWKLNLPQAALFSFVAMLPQWADSVEINGATYFHISKSKAAQEVPLVSEKPDTIYRLLRQLAQKELILLTSMGHRTLVAITAKGTEWLTSDNSPRNGDRSKHRKSLQGVDHAPEDLGDKSEPTPDNSPTDHINNNQSTNIIDCRSRQTAKKSHPVPDDLEPTETEKRLAQDLGVSLLEELPKFIDHHRAKGTTMKDWLAGLRNWLRNAAKFARERQSTVVQPLSCADRSRLAIAGPGLSVADRVQLANAEPKSQAELVRLANGLSLEAPEDDGFLDAEFWRQP